MSSFQEKYYKVCQKQGKKTLSRDKTIIRTKFRYDTDVTIIR